MNFEKLQKLDLLIKTKSSGTPAEFAEKIGISKSMLFRYIHFLKNELNAPVRYSKVNARYEYVSSGKLNVEGWERE